MNTRNSGSPFRRFAQWLGLVYNDDGSWGTMRIKTERGRQRTEEARAKRQARSSSQK